MDCFLFSRDTNRVKSVSIIGLRTDGSTGFSSWIAIASKKREGLEERKLHVSGEQGWSRWNSQTLRSRFRSTKRNALPIRPSSILAFCQSGPCRHILLCSKQFFLEVLNPQKTALRLSSKHVNIKAVFNFCLHRIGRPNVYGWSCTIVQHWDF